MRNKDCILTKPIDSTDQKKSFHFYSRRQIIVNFLARQKKKAPNRKRRLIASHPNRRRSIQPSRRGTAEEEWARAAYPYQQSAAGGRVAASPESGGRDAARDPRGGAREDGPADPALPVLCFSTPVTEATAFGS